MRIVEVKSAGDPGWVSRIVENLFAQDAGLFGVREPRQLLVARCAEDCCFGQEAKKPDEGDEWPRAHLEVPSQLNCHRFKTTNVVAERWAMVPRAVSIDRSGVCPADASVDDDV